MEVPEALPRTLLKKSKPTGSFPLSQLEACNSDLEQVHGWTLSHYDHFSRSTVLFFNMGSRHVEASQSHPVHVETSWNILCISNGGCSFAIWILEGLRRGLRRSMRLILQKRLSGGCVPKRQNAAAASLTRLHIRRKIQWP